MSLLKVINTPLLRLRSMNYRETDFTSLRRTYVPYTADEGKGLPYRRTDNKYRKNDIITT